MNQDLREDVVNGGRVQIQEDHANTTFLADCIDRPETPHQYRQKQPWRVSTAVLSLECGGDRAETPLMLGDCGDISTQLKSTCSKLNL